MSASRFTRTLLGLSTLGLLVCAVAALSSGCSNSSLANMWKDPAFSQGPMTNLLVVTMSEEAGERRRWEDGFVAELRKHNVNATPSYDLFPAAVPDTQQVVAVVQERGYDGVLVTRQLPTDTETHYVPGYTTSEPVTLTNPWTSAYYTVYRDVHHRGHVETQQVVRYETSVWTTKQDGRMVWDGTSEVTDPTSDEQVDREIAGLIVPELAKQGLVPNK
jgi:hypothetical protein